MQEKKSVLSRRDLLKNAGAAAVAIAIGSSVPSMEANAAKLPKGGRKRVLRVAHLTDIHLTSSRNAPKWLAACLHHVQEKEKADLILNTGDTIFDSMRTPESGVNTLWTLSQQIWKAECSLPTELAIGNHDVWGLEKARSMTSGNEPMYGKKWVTSIYGLEKTYRSFDRAGWHFIALDGVMPKEDAMFGFIGKIDEEQFEWLKDDLARVNPKTPVLIFSHIPIFSAAAFYFNGKNEQSGNWQVYGHTMHIDSRRITDLLAKHPNVKLCLSGHLHMVEQVKYFGITYLCNGAVGGAWWNGPYLEHEPGYGVIDLYADGSFENKYVTYGWKKNTV